MAGQHDGDTVRVPILLLMTLVACQNHSQSLHDNEQVVIPSKPDFSGSWEIDYRLSDQADQKIRWKYLEALAAEKRVRESQDPRFGPHLAIALENQSLGQLAAGVMVIGRFTEKISKSSVLTIDQDRESITIERDENFSLTCKFTDTFQLAGKLGKEQCGWAGDQLVFDIVLPEGLNVRHILSKGTSRLNLTTSVDYDRIPFALNRVYIPFEPGEGMYDCEFKVSTLKTCTMGAPDR